MKTFREMLTISCHERKDLASTRKKPDTSFCGWFGVIDEYCSGLVKDFPCQHFKASTHGNQF